MLCGSSHIWEPSCGHRPLLAFLPLTPPLSGDIQSTVTYDLALDPGSTLVRAIFEETKNNTRRSTRVFGLTQKCETLKLQLPVSRQMVELPAEDGVALGS